MNDQIIVSILTHKITAKLRFIFLILVFNNNFSSCCGYSTKTVGYSASSIMSSSRFTLITMMVCVLFTMLCTDTVRTSSVTERIEQVQCENIRDCVQCTKPTPTTTGPSEKCEWRENGGKCSPAHQPEVEYHGNGLGEITVTNHNNCKNADVRYDSKEAFEGAILSAAAYSDTPKPCLDSKLPKHKYTVLKMMPGNNNSFAYIAISHTSKRIVVSFRGTDLSKGYMQLFEEIVSILALPKVDFYTGGQVQEYFRDNFIVFYPKLRPEMKKLAQAYPTYQVFVTGHSLGGALASLAAVSLVHDNVVPAGNLVLFTYGCPRVGNQHFADSFDRIVATSWRVVHSRDIVAHLPTCVISCGFSPSFPFHFKTEVFYPEDNMNITSKYIICKTNEDNSCSDGAVAKHPCITNIVLCIKHHIYYFNMWLGILCPK